MADISANIVILTKDEMKSRRDAAFRLGVERGKFEANSMAPGNVDTSASGPYGEGRVSRGSGNATGQEARPVDLLVMCLEEIRSVINDPGAYPAERDMIEAIENIVDDGLSPHENRALEQLETGKVEENG